MRPGLRQGTRRRRPQGAQGGAYNPNPLPAPRRRARTLRTEADGRNQRPTHSLSALRAASMRAERSQAEGAPNTEAYVKDPLLAAAAALLRIPGPKCLGPRRALGRASNLLTLVNNE